MPVQMSETYVWLRTCDDSIQQVEEEIAMVCPFICQEISEKGVGFSESSAVCLPEKVSLVMLNIILDYCRYHHVQGHSYKERKLYDEEFVRIMDDRLCELSYAAFNLQLDPLIDLTCLALARKLKGSSMKEARDILNCPDDLTDVEKLEPFMNMSSELSDRLVNHLKRKKRERVLANVGIVEEKEEVHVVDERSIDELVSFINGSNDGETKRKKKSKNKKKNRRKKKDQQKNSSLKEEDDPVVEFDDEINEAIMAKLDRDMEKEDDPMVEFDDEIYQALMIDREVEEFDRRLNCTWEERKRELLRDAGNH